MMRRWVLFPFFLFCLSAAFVTRAGAVEFLSAGGGVSWIYSEVEDAAPDPVLFEGRVLLSVFESEGFFLRPAVSYYKTTYEWRNGIALPSEEFILGSAGVHVLSLKPRCGYEWPMGENRLSWSFYPVGLIRVAFDGGAGAAEDLNRYFWSGARFLALETGIAYGWEFENGLSMGLFLEGQFPVSNWWTDGVPSPLHGVSVSSGFLLGP